MSITWSKVRALKAAFETGSFSGAARRLGISQPAVTQQIRELEASYGVALFERRHHGLVPTKLCSELAVIANRIQAAEREATTLLANAQPNVGGTLRIGLGNAMPGLCLSAHFMRCFPGIELQIEMGNWATIIDAVLEHRVDVGVLPHVPEDVRFRSEICLAQRVVAIMQACHPLASCERVSCEDLILQPLLFRTQPSSTQSEVDKAFRQAKLSPKPVITFDTRDGVLEAVANNMGIGFMWENASIRTSQMVKMRVDEIRIVSHEYIFCLVGSRSRAVESFFACHGGLSIRA